MPSIIKIKSFNLQRCACGDSPRHHSTINEVAPSHVLIGAKGDIQILIRQRKKNDVPAQELALNDQCRSEKKIMRSFHYVRVTNCLR